jgi:hypothetical protein
VIRTSNHTSPPKAAYVGETGGPYLRAVERNPESFPPFAIFLERFGFIPNLFRAQTVRPDVLEAEAVHGGSFSATISSDTSYA